MKRFSFSRLLHNDRLMLVLSLVFAIWLWYVVLSGSANVTTRTITCTLNTANVKNGNLQVIDSDSVAVDIEVRGPWSVVTDLTADDIRVQLNSGDIQQAGNCRVHVLATRNSQINDYEIVSASPSLITLFCDEWVSGRVFSVADGTVTAEAPHVTAEGDERDIGTIGVDGGLLPGGIISVQGPQTVVSRIDHLMAWVPDEVTITAQQNFPATLVALDTAGDVVDLTYCSLQRYESDPAAGDAALIDLAANAVEVTVTVNERRDITFTYDVKNAPSGVDLSSIVSIEPASVTLEGRKEVLEQNAELLSKLLTLDFDTLSTAEKSRVIPVTLPEGVTVVGTGESQLNVTVHFDWSGYTTRTITWNLGNNVEESPITFLNVPADKQVTLLTKSLTVTVVGKRDVVSALKSSDLYATVDMDNSSLGTYTLRPIVNVSGAWVNYGTSGYTIYITKE